jgi:DNA invertase Pin-like site-specific DNA recombinase
MPKHVALYVRCSTEEQTTKDQIRELRAVAERHGWIVAGVGSVTPRATSAQVAVRDRLS